MKYKHTLTARHLLMISLGSAIGTGFFYGAGQSIQMTGASILLAYFLGGCMMYIVVCALGEMSVAEPNSGSFSYFAYRYLGHYAGFVSGWNYWFNYIIVSMLELSACSLFLEYWFSGASYWLTSLIILMIFSCINLMQVRFFGELEFWFAGIKVITIMALIAFGLYILFISPSEYQGVSGLSNLWQDNSFLPYGVKGFLASLVVVVFSFGGTELVGIAAGETENPAKNIPRAINGIIVRILLFYVFTLAIVMCLYPWQNLNSEVSPFVDVFAKMGITKAASLVNFVAITAALSSLNSGIYGTGRMLRNLSVQGDAPKILAKLSANHTPKLATLFSTACIGVTIILNYCFPKQTFSILLSIATIAAVINWMFILITHACFRAKSNKKSSFKLFAFPFSSIASAAFLLAVTAAFTLVPAFKPALYIAPIWMVFLSIGYFIKVRFSKVLKA